MPFTIKGCDNGRALLQTRVRPASAVVLAMNWLHAGIRDVCIEQDGSAFDVAAFQRQHSLTAKAIKRRALVGV